MKMKFVCPVCGNSLESEKSRLVCANNHSFDRAKSGYVNLLLSNNKHSKLPGDNKLMVNARRDFLIKEYYQSLAHALCETIKSYCVKLGWNAPNIVDAGCGEGYYTDKIYHALCSVAEPKIFGVDISKFALDIAAKKNHDIDFVVGSIFHLPVSDSSCDVLLNLFAPYCGEEFLRVLNSQGILLMVIPSRYHLWELKEIVYDTPYENEVKDYELDGFKLIQSTKIQDMITLSNQQDIQNLFMMTPYYYKTSEENTKRLKALESLTTRIEFELLVYQKVK